MKTREFEAQLDEAKIQAAIKQAETETSGEVRVFISRHAPEDVMAAARREFERLGMTRTPLRNAVLLYFAPRAQKFAIIGDEAIHLRCGEPFWRAVAGEMEALLKAGRFQEAILAGVAQVGRELTRHFPRHRVDRDDLPNTVVRD